MKCAMLHTAHTHTRKNTLFLIYTLTHVSKTLSINEYKQKQGITFFIPLLMHMKWQTKAFVEFFFFEQKKSNLVGMGDREKSGWNVHIASQLKTIYAKSKQMNKFGELNWIFFRALVS